MMMLPEKYREFWRGIRHGISLCCVIWFIDVHCIKRYDERREYQDRMNVMTDNAGIVLCPECVVRTLRSRICAGTSTAETGAWGEKGGRGITVP